MKKYILLFIVFAWCVNLSAKEKPTKILFLGNSYTYYNGVPGLISDMSIWAGKDVVVTQITRGGHLLEEYANSGMVEETIEEGAFDFVVLQEQSTAPLFKADKYTFPAIRKLDKMIRKNEGETVLFMTWAREYVDSLSTKMLPGKFYYDVFGSYDEAQDSLASAYSKIGEGINAKVAPVGLIWKEIHKKYPDLKLWRKDHNHPTETGTVIAAYAIYATIFNEKVVGLRCPLPIPKHIVKEIQEITDRIVQSKVE